MSIEYKLGDTVRNNKWQSVRRRRWIGIRALFAKSKKVLVAFLYTTIELTSSLQGKDNHQ